MRKTYKYENIEQLLSEADDFLRQIDSETIKDIEEKQRVQLEQQVQNLKKLKYEVQDKIRKKKKSPQSSLSEGMHEAINDIVKAMRAIGLYFS
jgi:tRNA uridine 5-carbamoylmethylation protein Kti12